MAPAAGAGSGRLGTVVDTVLKALIQGNRSQDLVLVSQPNPCTCVCLLQADLVSWGIGGSCFYNPFLGDGAGREMFLMKIHPGFGRDQTSELHQPKSHQGGDLHVQHLVQGEGGMERRQTKEETLFSEH